MNQLDFLCLYEIEINIISSINFFNMSNPEEYWRQEKKRRENHPYESNKLFKQTYEDMKAIESDKHPKALYTECLTNNPYWRHASASTSLTVDDLAMIIWKNVGWDLNYWSLIKKSITSDWKGSSDCIDEYKAFTSWIARESRRWLHSEHDMSMYDYIQNELEIQKREGRHKPVFDITLPEEKLSKEEDLAEKTNIKMENSYM